MLRFWWTVLCVSMTAMVISTITMNLWLMIGSYTTAGFAVLAMSDGRSEW